MAALFYIVIRFVDIYCAGKTLHMWGGGSVLPFLIKFLAPYTMATSAKLLFDVKEHLDHLKETNTKIYVSGMSAKARGYDENILKEYNAEFAMPDILIELSLEADSFLSF